jgi:DnaJ-class molecular chaperone
MMDYMKFLEIVTAYRSHGYDVIVKKCKRCRGHGEFLYMKKHKVFDHPCDNCHGTGRIVYPVTRPFETVIA